MNNELIKKSRWIIAKDSSIECPLFKKDFALKGEVDSCILQISAKGVFAAEINGKRISESVLMPGFTQYNKRLLYCTYDITDLLSRENTLIVETAKGWYSGRISKRTIGEPVQLIAAIDINYKNGENEQIFTDYTWQFSKGPMKFCDIYDGVIYDATAKTDFSDVCDLSEFAELYTLTEHDGAEIKEQERIKPIAIFKTPKGETVLDFGQNLVGTLETRFNAHKGDKLEISFAEILDKDGNFYNENYRSAKCLYDYTAKEGEQIFKPVHTFFGFRYIRVDKFPGKPQKETVALLSQRRPDEHIDITIDLTEFDTTAAELKATYPEIKEYVLNKFGLKVSSLYISQVKTKCGIIERENYNKGKAGHRVPQCPKEKEDAIMDALKHFKMI